MKEHALAGLMVLFIFGLSIVIAYICQPKHARRYVRGWFYYGLGMMAWCGGTLFASFRGWHL